MTTVPRNVLGSVLLVLLRFFVQRLLCFFLNFFKQRWGVLNRFEKIKYRLIVARIKLNIRQGDFGEDS